MKRPKLKTIIKYSLIAGLFVMLGFTYSYHLPNFKIWLIDQVEQQSRKTPFRVLISDIDFTGFPLGVKFENIRMYPNKEFQNNFDIIHIKNVRANLSILSLVTGHIQISKVQLTEPTVVVKSLTFGKTASTPSQPFNLEEILDVPLSLLSIINLNLKVEGNKDVPNLNIQRLSLEIENRQKSALVSVITPSIQMSHQDYGDETLDLGIGARFLLDEKQIYLSALKIKQDESFVLATGQADTNYKEIRKTQVKIKTDLKLDALHAKVTKILGDNKIPKLTGRLVTQMVAKKDPQSPLHVAAQVQTTDFNIAEFVIGNAKITANFQDKSVSIPRMTVVNDAGKVEIDNVKLSLENNKPFTADIRVTDIQLQTLLKNLNVGDVPVQLLVNSSLPCEGSLGTDAFLKCAGDMDLANLRVYGNKKDIIKFGQGHIKGSVEVNKKQVKTSAMISIGSESVGVASGYVDYAKGFEFTFDTQKFNFRDIDLADLKLEGKASLKGSTKGDSSGAVFGMETQAENFWITDYALGKFKANVNYLKGNLHFKNLSGLFRTTKYAGSTTVDLNHDRIMADANLTYVELGDIQKIFERKVTLPFEVYGGGTAQFKLEGPLDFSLLSYDLKSRIVRGHIANETFDETVFNVTSKNGNVLVQNAYLKKNNGTMFLRGNAYPNGQVKAVITGENFAIQDFNILSQADLGLTSRLDFNLALNDHILSPNTIFRGELSRTQIAQQSMDDSKFELSFQRKQVSGNAVIFGETIKSDFVIPFEKEAPFRLSFETQKWNFAPLLSIVSGQNASSEFNTELSGSIKLESPRNGIWDATGLIDFTEFRLRRGTKELFATRPINIKFDKGKMRINGFQLRGDNTLLEATSNNSSTKIDFGLNGKLDLSLMSFLTPFFTDIRGVMAISAQIKIAENQMALLGSAFVEDGYIKVKELPHAFENFNLDLLFSTDKILVNRFTSLFASGRLNANGQVEIKGFKNFPTRLAGTYDNVKLRMPEGFVTDGSGDFLITGNWFPYNLKVNYIISDGLITRKFDNYLSSNAVKRSNLLPDFLQKKESQVLDLNVTANFNRGIQVTNDLIDAKILGVITITGSPGNPILLGQMSAAKTSPLSNNKGNQLFFRETPFQITMADLKFSNPNKMNPSIYIEASTTVEEKIGNRTQNYDINLLIQGTAENPTINLTSTPPRNEKDIITLLALGISSENIGEEKNSEIYNQSVEIGSAILSTNPLGKEIKNRTGFNVKLSSGLDEVNNSAVPKVTISRQWTPRVETSASRTFGDFVTQDVKVEYQLNKHVSLIGSWEGKENAPTTEGVNQQKSTTDSILGLDLEYKLEFK